MKEEFELQDEEVLLSDLLDNYNIKPRDILYLLTKDELQTFCKSHPIKSRGNLVSNIITNYRDIDDLYIENFEAIGRRDLKTLYEKGLLVRESELGILYEKTARKILTRLGFNVDEKLRKSLGTNRLQMDILLNLGNQDVIILECKTAKDKTYNKYTPISRQVKSYEDLCENKGYHVTRAIVIANDFSEEFVSECEYDYELNLSLISSSGLVKILEGFKTSSLLEFPVRLLMRDGLLNEDRISKVLNK